MKTVLITGFLLLIAWEIMAQEGAIDPQRAANTIILDSMGVKNLGIEFAEAVETDFETTLFSIGRIQEIPSQHAVLSSRISGRVVELNVIEGDFVQVGQVVAQVESRQPGNPPPTIPLKAPLSGRITESHARLGEPVEPEKDLFHIIDLKEVWAVARVPEQDVGKLKPGAKAYIRVSAFPDQVFEGKLLRLGTMVNRDANTLDAVFRLRNDDLKLRPGMRAEFSIVTGYHPDVMAIPKAALQGDSTNRLVYVKDFELPNAFVRTPVQTGMENERYVEIVNGLFPGDEVVTKGSYFLGFAGGGGISLKEALDAAHGHEHNEDGSEMTAEQKKAKEAAAAHSGEGHHTSKWTFFWGATSALLFLLFIGSLFRGSQKGPA